MAVAAYEAYAAFANALQTSCRCSRSTRSATPSNRPEPADGRQAGGDAERQATACVRDERATRRPLRCRRAGSRTATPRDAPQQVHVLLGRLHVPAGGDYLINAHTAQKVCLLADAGWLAFPGASGAAGKKRQGEGSSSSAKGPAKKKKKKDKPPGHRLGGFMHGDD